MRMLYAHTHTHGRLCETTMTPDYFLWQITVALVIDLVAVASAVSGIYFITLDRIAVGVVLCIASVPAAVIFTMYFLLNLTAARVWMNVRRVCLQYVPEQQLREEFDQHGEPPTGEKFALDIRTPVATCSTAEQICDWVDPYLSPKLRDPETSSVLLFADSWEYVRVRVYKQ